MGSEKRYNQLETEVGHSETYYDDDFTRIDLILKGDIGADLILRNQRDICFELPKAVEVEKGDKILFHDCKLKKGGRWYMDSKSYRLLEIFHKDEKNSYFRLEGSDANRLERLAAKRFKEEAQ